MKLLHLFKESLENIESMRMNKSSPATLVTMVKMIGSNYGVTHEAYLRFAYFVK